MLDSNAEPVSLIVMGVTGTGKTTMAQELVNGHMPKPTISIPKPISTKWPLVIH